MKLNRFVSILVIAWLAAATGAAWAQSAPSYKIGFVDVNRTMRDSRVSKQAQAGLEAEFKKREQEILAGPASERDRRHSALMEDTGQRRDELLKQFIERANVVIRRIAEAENFDAIFYEATYASPRVDITDKVIKALDAEK